MTARKTAHLRALKPNIEVPVGQMFWANPDRARALIAAGAAEFVLKNSNVSRSTIPEVLERFKDFPFNRLSFVNKTWANIAAVVIGGGPSLTLDQVEQVRVAREAGRVRVIAVNDAHLWAPWADILYASDASWWADHAAGIAKPMLRLSAADVRERFEAFLGLRCSIQDAGGGACAADARIHIIRSGRVNPNGDTIHADGLSLDPDALLTGRNSGWQAINLAALAGASPVILLGIDGGVAPDGRSHWSGGHRHPTPQMAYGVYSQAFSIGAEGLRAAGIECWNCSPGTAIRAFPQKDLSEALAIHRV